MLKNFLLKKEQFRMQITLNRKDNSTVALISSEGIVINNCE